MLFRILSRVQAVLFRQTLAWILYGRLDDPAGEFFVKCRDIDGSQATDDTKRHSWNRSFALKLDFIPETHLSSLQASKILFAGKTASLLNQTLFATTKSSSSSSPLSSSGKPSSDHTDGQRLSGWQSDDVYRYLCTSHFDQDGDRPSPASTGTVDPNSPRSVRPDIHSQSKNDSSSRMSGLVPSFLDEKDLISFVQSFEQILRSSSISSVVLFNDLVDRIHRCSSNVLWKILTQQHDIVSFFHIIRNVYLLGKGEFYQVILDSLLGLTLSSAPEPAAMNRMLKWRVLRTSAKTLNLDDESLGALLDLTSSCAGVALTDFYCQRSLFQTTGSCTIEFMTNTAHEETSSSSSRLSFVTMCKTKECDSTENQQAAQWERDIYNLSIALTPALPRDDNTWTRAQSNSSAESSEDFVYGCLSLEEEQVLGKGFFFDCHLRRCLVSGSTNSNTLVSIDDEPLRRTLINQVAICFSRDKLVFEQRSKENFSCPASVSVRLQFYGTKIFLSCLIVCFSKCLRHILTFSVDIFLYI